MSVARTNIINFFSEEECDKYYALHKEFLKTLSDCGIKEATYVRASPTSLLYFSIIDSEEDAEEILKRANKRIKIRLQSRFYYFRWRGILRI